MGDGEGGAGEEGFDYEAVAFLCRDVSRSN